MKSFSSNLLAGLLMFGLSFLNPGIKLTCAAHDASRLGICQATRGETKQVINYTDPDFLTLTEIRISEEVDKATNNLNKDLKASVRDAVAKVKTSLQESMKRDIQEEIRKMNESLTHSTGSRIQEAVSNVKDGLNASVETRIQEEIRKQNATLEKMEQKANISLHECVRVNKNTLTNIERRWNARLIHLYERVRNDFAKTKMDILESVETDIEEKLRTLSESLTQATGGRIQEAVRDVKDSVNASVEIRIKEVLRIQNDTLEKMEQKADISLQEWVRINNISLINAERRWRAKLRHTHKVYLKSGEHLRKLTLGKFGDLQQSQELMYDVIKEMGFMRSGSWGVVVVVVGAMQLLLWVSVFLSFKNRETRQVKVSSCPQVDPPAQVDRGDRNTLCIVCFVDRDVAQVQRWTQEIVKETRASQRMRTLTHVIASRRDIRSVPTCRLALVFVNPDERQLILEDEFHMGSTRRDTVEAVRRKGAEVILIAYDDPTSKIRILADRQLFDPSLTQVTSHPVLRDLNHNSCVLSVKESFSEFQKRHLIDTIDRMFT